MKKVFRKILQLFINKNKSVAIIEKLASIYSIDLRLLYYKQQGILKYQNETVSGEKYFINEHLTPIINEDSIIFDVGANIGNYVYSLLESTNSKNIFCFEPNPYAYKMLTNSIQENIRVQAFNIGMGDHEHNTQMYLYEHAKETELGSLFESVITDIHKVKETSSVDIRINTIDNFCRQHSIDRIDFLKIDTEGYEFMVLKGAMQMIRERKIKLIQFEFNEMNVASRVFLKDFFTLLPDYAIYRLDTNRLIHLPFYESFDEVFQYQNFIAKLNPLTRN
jgi:FkbM family methyltransferase